ncbi:MULTISPECIES: sulfite-sensing transcriptional repressor BigR [Brucella]|uniref:sulfite-sensing transcriptional repressor BigR n=1 Tax=Brucella abortus TaxID=235 RepID=UPI0001B4A0ED|nr:sulfite-sensing transcriptional repressor BigR [Brucella abortus]ERM87596.1 ArsR family transcriptional regulator [Brucella abortus 82]ERT81004.1 biofilm growth-associated repressor [Brucella abortus 90-12178]ERU06182.1 biofilm growth-associated repressor [Brucella abortus 99-9971-135]AIJ58990.1 biofilm growth-associated repressor [Brucella abortus]AIJ62119.1 biofilm growth-associated repressor [Brucella abortus bv. 9 str. C68]
MDTRLVTREQMEARANEVAELLKTLSHPARLMLACTLAEGEYSVGELEEMLGIRQPTLSQQLGVLREADIVETRREAKQIYYRLVETKVAKLIDALYGIFCKEGTDS